MLIHVETRVQSQLQFLRSDTPLCVLGGKRGTALVKEYTQPAWVTEGNFISGLTTY